MAKDEKDPLTTVIRSLFGINDNSSKSSNTSNSSNNSASTQQNNGTQTSIDDEYRAKSNKQKALSALLDRFVGAKPNYRISDGTKDDYEAVYIGNDLKDQLDWLRGDAESGDTSKPGSVTIEYKNNRDPWSKSQVEVGQQIVDMSNAIANGTYDESKYNKTLVDVVNDLADRASKGETLKESRASYDAFWKIVDDVYANSNGDNAWVTDKLDAWSAFQNNKAPSGKSSWNSADANKTNTEKIIENLYNDNVKKNGTSISENATSTSSSDNSGSAPASEDSEDVITYTYKPGDTFGQVLLNLGLSDGTNLWGPGGDVEYYTQQLINQDMLDYRGNVKLGIPFKLRRRKK